MERDMSHVAICVDVEAEDVATNLRKYAAECGWDTATERDVLLQFVNKLANEHYPVVGSQFRSFLKKMSRQDAISTIVPAIAVDEDEELDEDDDDEEDDDFDDEEDDDFDDEEEDDDFDDEDDDFDDEEDDDDDEEDEDDDE